jgi:hypothetical protein
LVFSRLMASSMREIRRGVRERRRREKEMAKGV